MKLSNQMLKTLLCGAKWPMRHRSLLNASRRFVGVHTPSSNTAHHVLNRVKVFAEREGRQPRILISRLTETSLTFNPMPIATGFADLGFDVDVGPDHLSAEDTAQQGVNADVHIVHACNQASGCLISMSALRKELDRLGRPDILVVASGVIPEEHHAALYEAGVAIIFDQGGDIPDCALKTLEELESALPSDGTAGCAA